MNFDELAERAAAARREGVAAPADRPQQRRCDPDLSSASRAVVRAKMDMQVRTADSGATTLEFNGTASVYERGYEMWDLFGPYTEIVSAGAAEDLAMPGLDVPLVLAHDSLRRIARTTNGTLTLAQNDVGLQVHAPQLDPADVDVAYIAPKIRAELIDEMSFRFLITNGEWSPDFTVYRIHSYRIHRGDVAIVGYGANPFTSATLREEPDRSARAVAARLVPFPEELALRSPRF